MLFYLVYVFKKIYTKTYYMKINKCALFAVALGALCLSACKSEKTTQRSLLNVSYDPTREFYEEYNRAFAEQWQKQHAQTVEIKQSHGGSGKQARSVIDGLKADVVTLALAGDIDQVVNKAKLLPADWQKNFENNSCPYYSTIVFVVRKGNPRQIRDWGDLANDGVAVVTPNPRTSGGARWNYLSAWAWADQAFNKDASKTESYIAKLLGNVPVFDTGARGSTTTFAQRGIGDVLLAWENEAYLIDKQFPGKFEIIYPSISMRAEPPVAVVEEVAKNNGNEDLAKAYLQFLYSDVGQNLAAKHFYRPGNPRLVTAATPFKPLKLISIDEYFGGWTKADADHFGDKGTFQRLLPQR